MSRMFRMLTRQVFILQIFTLPGLAILLAPASLALQAPHSDETSPEREAWYLVRHRCFLCHNIDQPGAKFAPSLMGLFERQDARLINGKPVNDQTVTELIADGTSNMPAFKHTLNSRQIQLILQYLKGGFPNAPKQDGAFAPGPPR